MRYVTLRIECAEDALTVLTDEDLPDGVERGPVHRIKLLADGTIVFLRSAGGDLAALERAFESAPAVKTASVTAEGYLFAHLEPAETGRRLLEWGRRFPILLVPPIEFEAGDPIVTLVGNVEVFTDATTSLPDGVSYQVLEAGDHSPTRTGGLPGLTERQREVLAAAVDLGYYENPRRATQADIAEAVSVSAGTVGDHLRTIESRVLGDDSLALGDSG